MTSSAPARIAIKLTPELARVAEQNSDIIRNLLNAVMPGIARKARIRPLFDDVSKDAKQKLVDQAKRRKPGYQAPSDEVWWQVELDLGNSASSDVLRTLLDLVQAILRLDSVESAQVLQEVAPTSVTTADEPRVDEQGYLKPAPEGIDAEYAWTVPGGDGAGVGFIDVEFGWNLDHEDLKAAGITKIFGDNATYFDHGTGVLGIIRMVDNTIGGVGIAPASVGHVASALQPGGYNPAAAIREAAAATKPGDIVLVELHERDQHLETDRWPAEIARANFEEIQLATDAGRIVIEAAGNGNDDLDQYQNTIGNIFDQTSQDSAQWESGAIMVGAARSTMPHAREPSSNFGSRVDCFAWGDGIFTTSTDANGNDDTLYTTTFGRTSGAAAIVAGAAVVVQGIRRAAGLPPLMPEEMRTLVKIGGTPSANPAVNRIGVMPNLSAIIQSGSVNT